MSDSGSERVSLAKLCQNLGANEAQADVMAGQLLKRAEQMAVEKGTSREEALEYLLQIMISGRKGEVFQGKGGETGENRS